MVRAEIIFRGRVQGVGFRFTTTRVAAGFAVTGWVRNEPDGTVRCVAEGERSEIEAFIVGVEEAMAGYVTDSLPEWSDATGAFAGFDIRR